MTTQQPTEMQGANAWTMGELDLIKNFLIKPHRCDGFFYCFFMVSENYKGAVWDTAVVQKLNIKLKLLIYAAVLNSQVN